MRIVMVCSVFAPAYVYGGPPRNNLQLAQALARQGHAVTVLTTDANGAGRLPAESRMQTRIGDVAVQYLRRIRPHLYFFAPALPRALWRCRRQMDVVLERSHWTFINVATAAMCRVLRMPYVLYPEGTLSEWAIHCKRRRKALYWQLLEQRNYRHASGVVALTQAESEQVRALGCRVPIVVIPNGVDVDEFAPAAPLPAKRKCNILCMARIHPIKGLEQLLDAFAIVRRQQPDCVLTIAGPAEDESYLRVLQSQVRSLKLSDAVVFAGMVSSVKRIALFHAAHLFVLASHFEALPTAALEAAACHLPIVVTDTCNLPQIGEYAAGVVVQPNARSIADGILRGLANEDERCAMGQRAYAMVRSLFDWDTVARQTTTFCEQVR